MGVGSVIADRILPEEGCIHNGSTPLDGFPVVIGIVVQNDVATASALKDDAVPRIPNDVILYLVRAIPKVKFYTVIPTGITRYPVVVIAVPVLIAVRELGPYVG